MAKKFVDQDNMTKIYNNLKKKIEDNKVTVDTSMSDVSTNPVQNKAVKAYVDQRVGAINTALDTINGEVI